MDSNQSAIHCKLFFFFRFSLFLNEKKQFLRYVLVFLCGKVPVMSQQQQSLHENENRIFFTHMLKIEIHSLLPTFPFCFYFLFAFFVSFFSFKFNKLNCPPFYSVHYLAVLVFFFLVVGQNIFILSTKFIFFFDSP